MPKYIYQCSGCGEVFEVIHSFKETIETCSQINECCECDPQKSPNRMFAYMTYLQAPESGGETEFLHQSLRITPEVGTTLIWPAYFTHMHRGNPPLKGTKIYLTGWFHATGFVPSGTPKL